MPSTPLSHEEFRRKVCGVCLRKPKTHQNISPAVLHLIQKHHYTEYSLEDEFLPLICCMGCVSSLKAIDKVLLYNLDSIIQTIFSGPREFYEESSEHGLYEAGQAKDC